MTAKRITLLAVGLLVAVVTIAVLHSPKDMSPASAVSGQVSSPSATTLTDGRESIKGAQPRSPVIAGKTTNPDSFYLPGLGDVACFSLPQPVTFKGTAGSEFSFPMKEFYDSNGKYLRSEYVKEGSVNYESSRKIQEDNYEAYNETLSKESRPLQLPLPQLYDKVFKAIDGYANLANTTRLNINHVHMVIASRHVSTTEKTVFVVNVFGAGAIKAGWNEERHKRLRFVFDERGEILQVDNNI